MNDRKEIDSDFAAAYLLAQRVEQPEPKRILMKATERAIALEADVLVVSEAKRLVEYWKSMPEFITGSMAIKQLEDVLAGNYAPGGAFRKNG
jgi:hypothetical protein